MAQKVNLTHSGAQLESAINEVLSRQIPPDEIDVFFTDLTTEATITTGSKQGWLDPYLISGVV